MTSSAPYRPPHTWQSAPPEPQARGPRPDTQGNEQHHQRGGYRTGNQPRAFQQAPYAEQGGQDYRGQQRFQGGQRSGYRGNQQQHYHHHRHQHQHQFQSNAQINPNSQPWFPPQPNQPFNHHTQAQNPRPYSHQGYRQPHQHQHQHQHQHTREHFNQHQHTRDRRQPTRDLDHQSAPPQEKAPASAVQSDVADVTTKVAALQVSKPAPAAPRAASEEKRPAAEAAHEPLLDFDEGPLDPNINKQVGEDPHDEIWGAWHPEFREGKHVGYILERWEEEFDIEDYEDGDVSEINVSDPLWRKVEKTFEDGKLNEVYVHDNTGAVIIGFYEGGFELENFKVATVLWPLEEEDF